MAKLALLAVSVLAASCLSAGQVQAPNAKPQDRFPIANGASQTQNGKEWVPTFYSHANQVLVTVWVWKHAARSSAWVPKEALNRYSVGTDIYEMPPIARGLLAKDFRVFDNGVEQKINYLEESDFPVRDVNKQWFFYPHIRGTWGAFLSAKDGWLAAPTATYVIGYTPPPSQSDDCHTIRVVAGNNQVVVNRTWYCDSDEGNTTVEGRKLAAQLENFARSGSPGSIKVSSRPIVFWSSRVLSLLWDKPKTGNGSAPASSAANYTYVVVVHDSKAPATVQIATEYELGVNAWDYPCPNDHPAIDVLGVIYTSNGDVAARFGDRYPCRSEESSDLIDFGFDSPIGTYAARWLPIANRFNTQVELHPGDYDVHVVVSDGHKFGQARMPLRVRGIDSQALTISDLAVNGILRDASWVLRDVAWVAPAPLLPAPLVSKQAQFIPVPGARIPKKASLPLYFEIYEPLLADRSPETDFRMKITDLKDGTAVMNAGPTSAAQCVTPGNVAIPIALNVDTAKLPSGQYKIEVQASDSAGRTTEWRSAKFEIQ